MICIVSPAQLKEAFRAIDRDQVSVPHDLAFPLRLTDYIAWTEPSGHRVFLVFQDPSGQGARGIVFKRTGSSNGGVARMCQWCHSVRGGSLIRLLTAQASKSRNVGVHLCADLSCKTKVLGRPGVNDLREPYSAYEKLYRVILNMAEFAKDNLTFDTSGVASSSYLKH